MKAMRAHQFGGPETLRYEDAPDPVPQAGQVQIRVRAAGINPADLVRLSGKMMQYPLPYIPGTDVAGEVEAVGAGITNLKPGDRVLGRTYAGGYAEKTCMAATEAAPLPANLSFQVGAAIPIPFYTAYHALHNRAAVKTGETVLVAAGGGGVGLAAIQLAKLAGARVITTVGSREKVARVLEMGADRAVNYREQDFVAEAQKFTDNKGVDVIIESVATDNLARDFSALAPGGRIAVIGTGTAKSPNVTLAVGDIIYREALVMGVSLISATPIIGQLAAIVTEHMAEGKLKAVISKTYPLHEAAQAMNDLVAGKVFGKLILLP